MENHSFEIRVCTVCDLRFPLETGNKIGTRCPHCLGDTKLISRQPQSPEVHRPAMSESRDRVWHVLVDNLRSAWNVGSIMRSADGFGFQHAYLCGISPTPEKRAVQKTSLGAEEQVSWSYHKNAVRLGNGLIDSGWKLYALEIVDGAEDLHDASGFDGANVLIVGSETSGIDAGLLSICERTLHIPMRGRKRSFNAAVAFGIAAQILTAPNRSP